MPSISLKSSPVLDDLLSSVLGPLFPPSWKLFFFSWILLLLLCLSFSAERHYRAFECTSGLSTLLTHPSVKLCLIFHSTCCVSALQHFHLHCIPFVHFMNYYWMGSGSTPYFTCLPPHQSSVISLIVSVLAFHTTNNCFQLGSISSEKRSIPAPASPWLCINNGLFMFSKLIAQSYPDTIRHLSLPFSFQSWYSAFFFSILHDLSEQYI